MRDAPITVTADDYLWFVDEALAGMVEIVTGLGDDLANRRPERPAANSPYALLTHCLGVIEYWGGHVVAGRTIERDRAAEFRAHGPVADLVARVAEQRARLAEDVARLDPLAPPRGTDDLGGDAALPVGRTQGGALVHIYEELAQHRGQMEGLRDVLLAPWGRSVPVG
jgi:Protein of unknown function (DUF664)